MSAVNAAPIRTQIPTPTNPQIPAQNSQAPSESSKTHSTQPAAPENNGTSKFPSPLTPPPANRHLEILRLHKEKQAKSKEEMAILFAAIEKGDLETVKQLIDSKKARPDKANAEGQTPLHFAAVSGHLDIVKFLKEKGANLHEEDNAGRTPLALAALSGHLPIVKYLMKCGAHTGPFGEKGELLIHVAVAGGHIPVVKFLMKKGAKLDEVAQSGITTLAVAILEGRLEMIEFLIKNGIKLDRPKQFDLRTGELLGSASLIVLAATKNNHKIIEWLINNGCQVNETGSDGSAALHVALSWRRFEIAKILIDKGANLDFVDSLGRTPLDWAVFINSPDMVQLLINRGADINYCAYIPGFTQGFTPLVYAAINGNLDIVKLLIKNKANPNHITLSGSTAFYEAVVHGRTNVMEFLIDKTANPYAADVSDITPLQAASYNGHFEAVQFLVEHNHSPEKACQKNNTTFSDKTPLMFAAKNGQLEIVKYFVLDKKVDLHRTDKNGRTALQHAVTGGFWNIAEFLIDNGANANHAALSVFTALYYAAAYNCDDVMHALIQKSVRLDSDFNLELIQKEKLDHQHQVVFAIGNVWFTILTAPTVLMNKKKELEKTGQLLEHTEIMELARLRNNAQKLIDRLSVLTVNNDDDALMLRLAGVTLFSLVDFKSESLKNHPYLQQLFNIEKWFPEEERREAFLEKLSIHLDRWDSDGINKYGQGEMSIFHSEYARLPQITKSILEKLDY